MSIDVYTNLLEQAARRRSVRIAADGAFDLQPLADQNLALDVSVDQALFIPLDCRNFEAATLPVPVPLAASACVGLIDPLLWGRFSAIQTSNANKTQDRGAAGWSGTIEERVSIRLGGKAFDYHNLLNIEFTVGATGSEVRFDLEKCMQGGLAFETGFLRLQDTPTGMVLTSRKELRYAPPSDWCKLPLPVLKGILLTWLNAAAFDYAAKMVKEQRAQVQGPVTDAVQTLQAMPALQGFGSRS